MRALLPWNPYGELIGWHSDIDDLFNRFFTPSWTDREREGLLTSWVPAVETVSKDGKHIVRLDLPGVETKDVKVSVENDTLIIKGERKSSDEAKEKNYRYRETSYGSFERRFALPKGVDGDKVKASYKNGVLEVSVPLPARIAGKSIPIQVEEGGAKGLFSAA